VKEEITACTVKCPECGRKQKYLSDEWPDECGCGHSFENEEKDNRIAELERNITYWSVIELMIRNPNVDSFVKEKEKRIAEFEAITLWVWCPSCDEDVQINASKHLCPQCNRDFTGTIKATYVEQVNVTIRNCENCKHLLNGLYCGSVKCTRSSNWEPRDK
jgi:Zn finger protein HypA/HybF involved in hydrogenase expression